MSLKINAFHILFHGGIIADFNSSDFLRSPESDKFNSIGSHFFSGEMKVGRFSEQTIRFCSKNELEHNPMSLALTQIQSDTCHRVVG